MPTPGEVARIVLPGISLALKGNCLIGFDEVAAQDETQKPLKDIEDVETYVGELTNLGGVDKLVVDDHRTTGPFCKENTKEVNGIEPASEGNDPVVDNLHESVKVSGRPQTNYLETGDRRPVSESMM